MHPERALRLINLVDIPEHKRKFWPQHATVFVRSRTREIVDIIQFFSNPVSDSEDYHRRYYNDCRAFFAHAGQFLTLPELEAKINWCLEPISPHSYILGHGPVNTEPQKNVAGQ